MPQWALPEVPSASPGSGDSARARARAARRAMCARSTLPHALLALAYRNSHRCTPGSSRRTRRRSGRSWPTGDISARRLARAFSTPGVTLVRHPHVHGVVLADGQSRIINAGFVRIRRRLPRRQNAQSRLSREVCRRRYDACTTSRELDLAGTSEYLCDAARGRVFVDTLFETTGSSTPSRPLGECQPCCVPRRYTHRVAISNHRLLAFDGDRVTFRWKDYAHGDQRRTMTLSAMEFLRRFVQHILPRGFVRIRQSGFLANMCRAARRALA